MSHDLCVCNDEKKKKYWCYLILTPFIATKHESLSLWKAEIHNTNNLGIKMFYGIQRKDG